MGLTHLHIPLIVMQDTLYIEFTLIFTETMAYQCCNHTFSSNLKGEDSHSDCEENEDDLPPALACTQQNVCSTITEHEVQNGLEERDLCTVNTILPYVVQQHVTLTTIIPTLAVPVYWKKRASCSVNTIQPYVVQQNPRVAQTPAACPSDNNDSNLYSNSGVFIIFIGCFFKVEGKGVKFLSISHVMEISSVFISRTLSGV